MKSLFDRFSKYIAQVNSTRIRFVLMIVTLALLVIGASAPDSGGGYIG